MSKFFAGGGEMMEWKTAFTLLTLAVPRGLRDESSLISRHVDLGSFLAASMREMKYSRLVCLISLFTSLREQFYTETRFARREFYQIVFLKCLFHLSRIFFIRTELIQGDIFF